MKNHKTPNRRDQRSKRLTPHTYTKGSMRRRKQPKKEKMEANHKETKAQVWDNK